MDCFERGAFRGDAFSYTLSDLKRWTCCKAEMENAPGCTLGRHVESPEMMTILNNFPAPNSETQTNTNSGLESLKFKPKQATLAQPSQQLAEEMFAEDIKKEKKKKKKKEDTLAKSGEITKEVPASNDIESVFLPTNNDKKSETPILNGPVNHEVQPSDTLQGLSLKYGVKVSSTNNSYLFL